MPAQARRPDRRVGRGPGRRPPPDPAYLEAVTTNPDLETVFLHMDAAGVGVTLKKR